MSGDVSESECSDDGAGVGVVAAAVAEKPFPAGPHDLSTIVSWAHQWNHVHTIVAGLVAGARDVAFDSDNWAIQVDGKQVGMMWPVQGHHLQCICNVCGHTGVGARCRIYLDINSAGCVESLRQLQGYCLKWQLAGLSLSRADHIRLARDMEQAWKNGDAK